ncbi:unnamed protein product [Brassica rapa subsp. narinosa]|uniref:(rape) hypothetical protein n=1 Tax=Brassica napus TaxID=3708 RepID=A0A817A962_BRANA|nr:unnamed protein product [Brassica napus]
MMEQPCLPPLLLLLGRCSWDTVEFVIQMGMSCLASSSINCDLYINNGKAIREATICFMMDPQIWKESLLCSVFLRDLTGSIDMIDTLIATLCSFDINMKGPDGIQGPIYVGTGCVFRRQALHVFVASAVLKDGAVPRKRKPCVFVERSHSSLPKVLAGVNANLTVTSKAADDGAFSELYISKWTTLLIPPTILQIINIVGVIVGISDAISNGYDSWGPLFGRLFFALWSLFICPFVHLYPLLKGVAWEER